MNILVEQMTKTPKAFAGSFSFVNNKTGEKLTQVLMYGKHVDSFHCGFNRQ
jgi:hypothetical protein